MSQRRNYGTLLLLSSLVLGVFLLTGSFIWMQDKANMILAVFVLILYGMGQWMTVVYWQRIQSDWEATGEVLGRLQQAVSDIPAALDANLKSIATRLTDGQAHALAKLQAEVSEGARATLEQGAGLISESLGKHLRGPLASLETTLAAWQQQADAQTGASHALGEELRRAQGEWSEQAKRIADGLSAEFKAMAGAAAQSGESAQKAWADRAAQTQAAWENRVQELQSRLLENMVSKVEGLQKAQSETQGLVLDRALTGMESQARLAQETAVVQAKALQDAAVGQTLALREAAAAQSQALRDAAAAFEDGLTRAREASLQLVRDVEANASAGQSALVAGLSAAQYKLVEEITALQRQTLGEAAKNLEAQGQLGLNLAGKVSELAEQMRQGAKDTGELAHVSSLNQVEMQASVAMLNSGLSSILDRLENQADAGDGYQSLVAGLGRTLASFQERAGEVLVENAMKTQEILMEVLQRQENPRSQPPAEGHATETGETTLATVS